MCPRSIAGAPSSQALLGFRITAPPSMCAPDVIGALAVWIQTKRDEKKRARQQQKQKTKQLHTQHDMKNNDNSNHSDS